MGFVNKLFISVQLIFFLDHVFLLAELAQKFKFFKIAVLRSDSMKRNLGRFIFTSVMRVRSDTFGDPIFQIFQISKVLMVWSIYYFILLRNVTLPCS